MDENKLKSVFLAMNAVGSSRTETWFLSKRLSIEDLRIAVELGFLIKFDKDPSNFLSDTEYELTQQGFDFAWGQD